MSIKYSGEKSPVSGFPIEWRNTFAFDGEYDCSLCKENNTGMCYECCDYGTEFDPTEGALSLLEEKFNEE